MQHILALAPVVLTLFIAFHTRKMVFAFLSGILSASLIYKHFSVYEAVVFSLQRFAEKSEIVRLLDPSSFFSSSRLFIFIFLIAVGCIIELIRESGASTAYAEFIKKYIKGRQQAECATLGLSLFLFFDDYFNTITTASVMKEITDLFGIARIRCAQLIGNTSTSIAAIMPLSTWGAAIVGTLASAGINLETGALITQNPFFIFLWSIPFALYPIALIIVTWITTLEGTLIGYASHEQHLTDLKSVHHEQAKQPHFGTHSKNTASLKDFFIPIFTLIASLILAILYTGKLYPISGDNSLFEAINNCNLELSMFMSGMYTLMITVSWFVIRKKITLRTFALALKEGFLMMFPSIIILSLSWTFSSIIAQELSIGKIIIEQLLPLFSMNYLPPAFFAVSALTAFCLGSSWGTMTLLYPIAIPMLAHLHGALPHIVLFKTIGAILSGAVLGNNTSPLADLGTMTSSVTDIPQMDYIRAQIDFNKPIAWAVFSTLLLTSFFDISSYSVNLIINISMAILFSWVGVKTYAQLEQK
jgi:tetracycline resistance efflux pump